MLELVSNNLSSPEAFAEIDGADLSLSDWQFVDKLFGLDLVATSPDVSAEVLPLIEARETARSEKNFAAADKIRDDLAAKNITVLDTPSGPIWQYLA